ncbi:hypothetical protein BJF92_12005 [Rhizobium rhizosphaerae]|uniref:NTP pyrophosphohydrolase MazG putative catalytic core domain-containing protein n=2 Tax=Xaviernesmea rhizosphaerae TaxID=1672749 RepID=A0A1Q9AN83_9HYPH|nr:hypothetical protein BJF92_12005 [Xaviernesmea rhizosphaerae]
MSFRAIELAGEAGEALNVVKKLERERQGWAGSRATLEQLAEELADVVICADLLALAAGIDLAVAVPRKFNATSEKVGLATRIESGRDALRAAYKQLEQQMMEAGFAVTSSEPLAYISLQTLVRLVADKSGQYQMTVPRDQPGPTEIALFTWPTPFPEADPPQLQNVTAEGGCDQQPGGAAEAVTASGAAALESRNA